MWVIWLGFAAVAGTAAYVVSEASLLVSVATVDLAVLLALVVTSLVPARRPVGG